jgi:periplasmic protein TonB
MIKSTNRQRGAVGWSVSIVFHAGLLIFGAAWLIRPARIQVEAGKSAMEIDFAVEAPVPVPVITPPAPTLPPTPVPPPQPVQTVPIAKPVQPEALAAPQPVLIPPPKTSVTPDKPKPPKPAKQPKPELARQKSSIFNGAVAAQPDELHNEPPEYPEASRTAHEEGDVFLRVEVTAAGEPESITIERSSGYSRLDHAAEHAVQHWKFHPATTAGVPVSSEVFVPIHFKLEAAG